MIKNTQIWNMQIYIEILALSLASVGLGISQHPNLHFLVL
jgi:hypothetical protein